MLTSQSPIKTVITFSEKYSACTYTHTHTQSCLVNIQNTNPAKTHDKSCTPSLLKISEPQLNQIAAKKFCLRSNCGLGKTTI